MERKQGAARNVAEPQRTVALVQQEVGVSQVHTFHCQRLGDHLEELHQLVLTPDVVRTHVANHVAIEPPTRRVTQDRLLGPRTLLRAFPGSVISSHLPGITHLIAVAPVVGEREEHHQTVAANAHDDCGTVRLECIAQGLEVLHGFDRR